ncbi:MAG: tetraacyldisaccharide 4'-kinase [Planctomycetota bacterium]|jgi:tetraacyldisaccharide 4'-kinase|nr:tetraacyldisaccharide 4'-kinase [Planctomycetota bacterium]
MDEQALRRTLEGGGGFPGRLLRAMLWAPGMLYAGVMEARRGFYDAGLIASVRSPLPTVSVGNIVMGGTGKTPFVLMLAREFAWRGIRPGILLRGYRKDGEGESDEAAMYRRECPEAVVVADADRVAGAGEAARAGAGVLLLDDGFQHRRLSRDMDVVLVDAMCPWGSGWTIPAGTLREPKSALRDAGAVIVTRSDQASEKEAAALRGEVRRLAPCVPVFFARHRASRLRRLDGEAVPLAAIRGQPVFALSGIARPEAFWKTLDQVGAKVIGKLGLRDHDEFAPEQIRSALAAAKHAGGVTVVTEKDASRRVFRDFRDGETLWVLGIEQELSGKEDFLSLLRARLGVG